MQRFKIIKTLIESLKIPIYLNSFYKINGQNEYRKRILQPSKCKNNAVLVFLATIIIFTLMPIIIIIQALRVCYGKMNETKIQTLDNKKIMICTDKDLPALKLLKNTTINLDDIYWIVNNKNNYCEVNRSQLVSINSLLSLKDITLSIINTIIVYYLSIIKYGQSVVFLGISYFDWFTTYFGLSKTPQSCELLFYHQINILVPLIDSLPHKKKILLQHGTLIFKHNPRDIPSPILLKNKKYNFWTYNSPYKFKTLQEIYAFSIEDFEALTMAICNCKPRKKIIGYSLKTIPVETNKPVILIIGYYKGYGDKETAIIKALQNLDVTILIKNHPYQDKSVYDQILQKYRFKIIDGPIFPQADVVISYESTLALEYASSGYKVLYYDDLNTKYIESIISDYIHNK